MKWALWTLALAVDALAVIASASFFISDAPFAVIAWGIALMTMFGALFVLLVKPQLFGRHAARAVATLSIAIPSAMFIGSLDLGRISGQEAYAILFGCLVGWLNWSAFRRQHGNVATKAA